MDTTHNLRGVIPPVTSATDDIDRMLQDTEVILLPLTLSLQIALSSLLGFLALIQILVLASFIRHRSKRVLEFAQPIFICVFIGAGIATTLSCYLFIFKSNVGCIVREPLIFISLTIMGSTIAGRAWRISSIINGPLLSAGRSSSDYMSRVERIRQLILQTFTNISGCKYSIVSSMRSTSASSLRVKMTKWQMARAITILVIPQLILQVLIMGVPSLRSSYQVTYSNELGGVSIGQYQCKSSAVGAWTVYVSILLSLFPHCCAYVLNCRSKAELDQLPDICNEKHDLELSYAISFRVFLIALPTIAMTWFSPNARTYVTVGAVLVLPLSLCYHIAYIKLSSIKSSMAKAKSKYQRKSSKDIVGDRSAAVAMKLAEMYQSIGRTEETIQLVDETLETWRKSSVSSTILSNLGQRDGKENIGSGFTRNDLKNLDPDELQSIIRLLDIKSKALMKLHGPDGVVMAAKLNVDALKIFENCPSASKLKDVSIIFPIYSLVSMQIKLGIVDQDDKFSLEVELAERYCREAQTQSYHYARALIALAELYGRMGDHNKALKVFSVMESVYLPDVHPALLSATYAVDKCAIGFASSALWLLQKGENYKAVERCEYVAENILPRHDDKDFIGLFSILLALIRVLKFNGFPSRALEIYKKFTSDDMIENPYIGTIHKPLLLLLKLSSHNSTEKHEDEEELSVESKVAMAFNPMDLADNLYRSDCLSIRTVAAELCLRLATKFSSGCPTKTELVDKGIQMATLANKYCLAETGEIKHILAHEANAKIQTELLKLAQENNLHEFSRCIIHKTDDNKGSDNSDTTKSSKNGISRRLVIKENDSSNGTSTSSAAPSNVHISEKKKVSFSHLSSLDSKNSH